MEWCWRVFGLYRRLNVIVYLNPGWREQFGGNLELYGADGAPAARIVPEWGRCVIFGTDDRSVHGFPQPTVEGQTRRSIATYYYTSYEATGFSGDRTTYWRQHGEEHLGRRSRAQLRLYKGVLWFSRALSHAAYRINPNRRQG